MRWQFWIDVGGTFTDCVAIDPAGLLHTSKVLSSGVTKGTVSAWSSERQFRDANAASGAGGYWVGHELHLIDATGARCWSGVVTDCTSDGEFSLDRAVSFEFRESPLRYELQSPEPAPLVAIRRVLGIPLTAAIPPCDVRLGTTRGTNALLERRGACVAFVTTRGFADVLRIGTQDRPRLFELAIRKPPPLYADVMEVDERLAADGSVLLPLDESGTQAGLARLRQAGVDSLAVCQMHAYINPAHERRIGELARSVGFREVSLSHEVSPRIRIVPRGETTVVDAYLNPVLRDYVSRIEACLQRGHESSPAPSTLRLMTSSGGLVAASAFSGKDSILSGPAGGVVGFARVAEEAGFSQSIGFDMGGTSTDVSRFAGEFEIAHETIKAGVRISTPLLDIETVAAGGGSICGFDGVQLFVGPQSAGADPGPACYGRGGPLTVTDLNLALGRLPAERFPFPLDSAAVAARLHELCEQVAAAPLGRTYDPLELAEGLLSLANATMARAIRRVSIAKGYDPADYALVTFGGAGGMHACAVAESLRMRSILIHPLAGVLSAYGMGLAAVQRVAERPVLREFSVELLSELEAEFRMLESSLRAAVLAAGIAPEQLDPPRRSLDLRYRGVEGALTISTPDDGDFAAAYEREHERSFGYRHTGRPLEVVSVRVVQSGRLPQPRVGTRSAEVSLRVQPERREVRFAGTACRTPIILRDHLRSGDSFSGPAIVCEPTSTIVIEPGWSARVLETGAIVLTSDSLTNSLPTLPASAASDHSRADAGTVDPVALEIFNQRFASIAEQMGLTLQRTAISTNVKERLDFSCALFDASGRLVVNAPHIPVHLGAMGETVRAVLRDCPDLAPGDVVVTNDPYRGGSHLPDVTVVTPVFDAAGQELLFVTASRAHHAEIGGIVPGSMPPFSRTLAEEGVLIRNFRLIDRGQSRWDELRQLFTSGPYPTRRLDDNLADLTAQLAANRIGTLQLQELVAERGLSAVRDAMRNIQSAAAAKMRRALGRIVPGVYACTDHLDDGTPIAVRIEISGDAATIDFTGSGDVLASNLNANRAIVTAAVMYVFRCLIDEEIPLNEGVLEPLTLIVPPGVLSPPPHDDPARCAAIVGGNVETSQRVVDVLLGALGLAAASQGTMNNLTFGDSRFGYYETICGGSGATRDADGADAVHTHMTNTRLTDAEVLEHRYPVRLREFSIRRGSGGAGARHGGDGVVRQLEFLAPLTVSMLSQRRGDSAPFGLDGGHPGTPGRNTLRRADSTTEENLGGSFQAQVAPGDILSIATPGGGGCGPLPQPGE
jgi:5-oxoprolinase (ATP-hydrolysing)